MRPRLPCPGRRRRRRRRRGGVVIVTLIDCHQSNSLSRILHTPPPTDPQKHNTDRPYSERVFHIRRRCRRPEVKVSS